MTLVLPIKSGSNTVNKFYTSKLPKTEVNIKNIDIKENAFEKIDDDGFSIKWKIIFRKFGKHSTCNLYIKLIQIK